jgi:hypothetical protein
MKLVDATEKSYCLFKGKITRRTNIFSSFDLWGIVTTGVPYPGFLGHGTRILGLVACIRALPDGSLVSWFSHVSDHRQVRLTLSSNWSSVDRFSKTGRPSTCGVLVHFRTELRHEAAQVHLRALPYLTGVANLASTISCTRQLTTGIARLGSASK